MEKTCFCKKYKKTNRSTIEFRKIYSKTELLSLIGKLLILLGSTLGNVVGLTLSGYLCEYGFSQRWDSIFYVFGMSSRQNLE